MRLVQSFFRRSVLTASHIIPWTANVELRADPRNGLSLCALHARAFDRGLMCVDENLKLRLSRHAESRVESEVFRIAFTAWTGSPYPYPSVFIQAQRRWSITA